MSDPLTVQLWPWVLIGLGLLAVFLGLANHYMSRRLPRAREALDRVPVLIGSGLDGLAEDGEVEYWDRVYAMPTYEGER